MPSVAIGRGTAASLAATTTASDIPRRVTVHAGRPGVKVVSLAVGKADPLLACDFLETVSLTGARLFLLAIIEHVSRRIRILGATAPPTAAWVAQAVTVLERQLGTEKARFDAADQAYLAPCFTGSRGPLGRMPRHLRPAREK